MRIKADPGGFPERRLSEVPSVTPQDMREIQKLAIEQYGMEVLLITENVARAAATLALAILGGHGRGRRVVVLAGGGNVGAAGLAMVRHLSNWGVSAEPFLGEVESEFSFEARRQLEILRKAGIVEPVDTATSEMTIEDHLERAELVVDALAGYGLEGPPSGMMTAVINLVQASHRPVLALDVPTGMSASSGAPGPCCVHAITTLALDLPKKGVIDPAARSHVGELYLADVGVPRVVYERMGVNMSGVYSDGPIVRLRR